jgi:hypothetical protein
MSITKTAWSSDRVSAAAHEVFLMESQINGLDVADAVAAAIQAAIESQAREMLRQIRDWALTVAEEIDFNEDGLLDDGPASLIYFAMQLDDEIPMEDRDQ